MHVPLTEIILRLDGAELARVTLPPGEYVIGRSREADIRADTPQLSRKHALLTINYDHLLLEDLGSSNGTVVGEVPISEATRLFPNQPVRLGDVTLEVRRERAPDSAEVSLAPMQAAVRRALPSEVLSDKRYAINGMVARGGMGAILEAKQNAIARKVAMKVMLDSSDPADALRFIDEAKITGQLEHPNIVPIYELGVDAQDQLFYAMKFVRGITLKKVLELLTQNVEGTVKKYPLAALLTIFQKACDAIAFAHSKGVIHRDLKPENLMLGDFGEVLVMDWGLAKALGKSAAPTDRRRSFVAAPRDTEAGFASTLAGTVMGTPHYMSPEQAAGEIDSLDARTDIYALGAILFEILHLRSAITGNSVAEVLESVRRGAITWPDTRVATARKLDHLPGRRVPESLDAIVRKAMALDPARRYAAVEALQADVTAYQQGFATSAEAKSTWKQARLLIKRNKTASIGTAAVLLVGTAFGTRAILEGRRAEREAANYKATLTDLRRTAPILADQAKALLDAGKVDEALERIRFAIQLEPQNTAYHLLRANVLQSNEQLVQAAEEYRRVLAFQPGHLPASTNLALCERWLRENGGEKELKRELQMELVDALLAQNRRVEAGPLAARLGKGQETIEPAILARLNEYQSQPGWHERRVKRLPTGGFAVDLGSLNLGDLSVLRGLPITELNVSQTKIADLSGLKGLSLTTLHANQNKIEDLRPLRGMKLVNLHVEVNPVSDLSPLSDMHLRELGISACNVTKLSPLQGMPLETLNLSSSPVSDLSALAGMPLRRLNVSYTRVRDLRPLAGSPLRSFEGYCDDLDIGALAECRELEEVSINRGSLDAAVLERLPNLQRIWIGYPTAAIPRDAFFEPYEASKAMLQQVRTALYKITPRPKPSMVEPYNAQGVRVNLVGSKIKNISALHGLPIAFLDLADTEVEDIEPLRELPLVWLSISPSKVTDVSPLLDCPALESVMLPKGATNAGLLKQLRHLRYISDNAFDTGTFRPAQTATEFWADYDARKGSGN